MQAAARRGTMACRLQRATANCRPSDARQRRGAGLTNVGVVGPDDAVAIPAGSRTGSASTAGSGRVAARHPGSPTGKRPAGDRRPYIPASAHLSQNDTWFCSTVMWVGAKAGSLPLGTSCRLQGESGSSLWVIMIMAGWPGALAGGNLQAEAPTVCETHKHQRPGPAHLADRLVGTWDACSQGRGRQGEGAAQPATTHGWRQAWGGDDACTSTTPDTGPHQTAAACAPGLSRLWSRSIGTGRA